MIENPFSFSTHVSRLSSSAGYLLVIASKALNVAALVAAAAAVAGGGGGEASELSFSSCVLLSQRE